MRHTTRRSLAASTLFAALLSVTSDTAAAQRASFLPSASTEQCAPFAGSASAQSWIDRAIAEVMPANVSGKVLRYRSNHDQLFWEQSDRMYEPFIPNMNAYTRWYDLQSGAEGRHPFQVPVAPGKFPSAIVTRDATFAGRDTMLMPAAPLFPFVEPERMLNPWAVLHDWKATADSSASSVRVVERCTLRDFPRVVLTRKGAHGIERLYLDEYSTTPVQLSRTEPHYLWGQARNDYIWNTWWAVDGGGSYPQAAHRIVDGFVYGRQANPTLQLIPADSAPRLSVPAVPKMTTTATAIALPDTVRVSANTFLLVNRAYTNVVTLQKDTVYVLDATTSEERSRADSVWIGKLFPGKHPVVLVVTDLAWPHISGVRYWIANRTPIVTHAQSTPFLQRVIDRRWTLAPDLLEQKRAAIRPSLNARTVRDSLRLAGGALTVHAIRGISSEGAILVSIPGSNFVWVGDYVQAATRPTQYAREVVRTLTALGLSPERIAAQHLPLTEWSTVVKANTSNQPAPRGGIFH
ncbi:MAG: hypothetical protein ACO1Q7_10910 [Gemmatimonas sp.]